MEKRYATLDDKFQIVFPDRYTKIIGKSDLKLINEKPINFTYNGLKDVKNGKKYTKLNSHNLF